MVVSRGDSPFFCWILTKSPDFLHNISIDRLSGAIKRYFSGVVGEPTVLKWAVFIAVAAVRRGLQPETT